MCDNPKEPEDDGRSKETTARIRKNIFRHIWEQIEKREV